MWTLEKFNDLVVFLRSKGYKVRVKKHLQKKSKYGNDPHCFAWFEGNRVKGSFYYTDGEASYFYDAVTADHEDCYDKPARCPVRIQLPADFDLIYKQLQKLSTYSAYRISVSYLYILREEYENYFHHDPCVNPNMAQDCLDRKILNEKNNSNTTEN